MKDEDRCGSIGGGWELGENASVQVDQLAYQPPLFTDWGPYFRLFVSREYARLFYDPYLLRFSVYGSSEKSALLD